MNRVIFLMCLLMITVSEVSAGVARGVEPAPEAKESATPSVSGDGVSHLHATQAERVARACRTGSLLFSRGDCLAVRVYTNSPYTHVATVIAEDQGLCVYDSMNGSGVRKLTLAEFLEIQAPDELHLFHPVRKLTSGEERELRLYLESQIGRPYAVSHHLTGKRCEGLHCAEYITDALVDIDWLRVENSARVSPASLVEGIVQHRVYTPGESISLERPLDPVPEPSGRCARLWLETKLCVVGSCQQLSRWVLCR